MCPSSWPFLSCSTSSPRPVSSSLISLSERQRQRLPRLEVDRNPLGHSREPLFWPWLPCSPVLSTGVSVSTFFLLPGASRVQVHLEGSFVFGELGSRLSPQHFWPHPLGWGSRPSRSQRRHLGMHSSSAGLFQPLTLERETSDSLRMPESAFQDLGLWLVTSLVKLDLCLTLQENMEARPQARGTLG